MAVQQLISPLSVITVILPNSLDGDIITRVYEAGSTINFHVQLHGSTINLIDLLYYLETQTVMNRKPM